MNDNDTWTTLGFQTQLMLNRIRNAGQLSDLAKEQEKDTQRDTGSSADDEKRANDKRAYVEKRLAETAKWERRISGK